MDNVLPSTFASIFEASQITKVELRINPSECCLEHVLDGCLLVGVVLLAHHRVQPVRMLDPWHRIGHLLQRCWHRDDLLDSRIEAASVVAPVDDAPQVHVARIQRPILEPSAQIVGLHRNFGIEYGNRYGAFGDWRCRWLVRNDVFASKVCIPYHLVTQELSETPGNSNGCRFLLPVVFEGLGHGLLLGDELEQLLVLHVGATRVENIHPAIRHLSDLGVAGGKIFPFEERGVRALTEDLGLEDLDQFELAATLELESLELC